MGVTVISSAKRGKPLTLLSKHACYGSFERVPEEGLEPSCPCGRQILSLVRLPFRHPGGVQPLDTAAFP